MTEFYELVPLYIQMTSAGLLRQSQKYLAWIPAALLLVGLTYASIQKPGQSARAVIIESRIYLVKSDESVVDEGSQIAYISKSGSWRKVQKDSRNRVQQVLIADSAKGAIFGLQSDQALKLGDFKPMKPLSADNYRANPQFAGEVSILGFQAYVQRVFDEDGKISLEATSIPGIPLSVKEVFFLDDGGKRIIEAISITEGEPPADKVQLPANILVREAVINQRPNPQN